MSEYTPTTEDVRRTYTICRGGGVSVPEFDRWLTQIEREAAALALTEAATAFEATSHAWGKLAMVDHLRARAAEIRGNHGDD